MTNAHKEWSSWLKKRNAAEEAARIEVGAYKSAHEKTLFRLHHCLERWETDRVTINMPPTDEQVEQVLQHLNALVSGTNRSVAHWQHLPAYKDAIHSIKGAWSDAQEAERELEAKKAEKATADSRLTEVEKLMPEPAPDAVQAIESDLEERWSRVARIDDTLSTMKDSGSITSDLEEQAAAAKREVDRLEAQAMLGDVDEKERQAAAATLAKARKASEKSAEQAEKQAAARRGLEEMRAGLLEEIDSLSELKQSVGFEVAKADIAKHEAALVSAIERLNIPQLMQNLNSARADASRNAPEGHSYSTGRIKITFPTMYAIDEPEEIETSGLELTE